jgi:hypothetical protein
MLRIAGVLLIYLLVAAPLTHAQTLEERYGTIVINDDVARDSIRVALQKIDRSMCGPQTPCAPATPEEIAQPAITVGDARTAMVFGIKSALVRWCALGLGKGDALNSFWRLLDWTHRQKMNIRQSQLAVRIYEDFHARQFTSLLGPCPDQLRKELVAQGALTFCPSTAPDARPDDLMFCDPSVKFGPSTRF